MVQRRKKGVSEKKKSEIYNRIPEDILFCIKWSYEEVTEVVKG